MEMQERRGGEGKEHEEEGGGEGQRGRSMEGGMGKRERLAEEKGGAEEATSTATATVAEGRNAPVHLGEDPCPRIGVLGRVVDLDRAEGLGVPPGP